MPDPAHTPAADGPQRSHDTGADPSVPAVTHAGGAGALRPGTPREWLIASGRISGLMLVLTGSAMAGAELPEPLGRRATRAWGRIVRAMGDSSAEPLVPVTDLDVLGTAAQALGHELCRYRVSGVESASVSALLIEARVHDTSAEQLVAQVARVHGVLDAGPGATADQLWRAIG